MTTIIAVTPMVIFLTYGLYKRVILGEEKKAQKNWDEDMLALNRSAATPVEKN
ncbi:hypothetical protein HDV05_003709 [Chytridiales sp. JEL 0842]|nr:hypothetical protein HDV05_003709 [Chytridiales sp. JEL 0842]